MAYDAAQLLAMSQAQLDDLFRAVPRAIFPTAPPRDGHHRAGHEILGAHRANHQSLRVAGEGVRLGQGLLKNKILAFGFEAIVARVYKGPSWLDNKECIVLDYSDTSSWRSNPGRDPSDLTGFLPGRRVLGQGRLIHFSLQF